MLVRRRLGQSAKALCTRHFSQNVKILHTATSQYNVSQADSAQNNGLKDRFIGIKANIVTKTPIAPSSTAASKTLSNYHTPFHATVVKQLIEHGAKILPNANMDEFGMGSHSQSSYFGPVKSPYSRGDLPLSPGGSSGGSAVWVKQELCWAALGTDTGGSVRLPAAWTGVVGFKPSYGRISRWGVIAYANSLDTVGVLARDVQAAKEVFEAVDQYDKEDPTSLKDSVLRRFQKETWKRRHLRIGIPLEYNIASLSPTVKEAYMATLNTLQTAGHTVHPVSLPSTKRALSAYYILAPAEASSNLAKYDGIRYGHRTDSANPDASPNSNPALPLYAQTRGESFGDEVKRRILLGAYPLSSEAMDNYFIQAQKVRRLVQQDFDAVFSTSNPLLNSTPRTAEGETVDLLLTPTAPTLPPTLEELTRKTPVESYMNDVFTVPASLAGLPAVSIPVPLSAEAQSEMEETDIKTAGMQLIGQFGDDEMILKAAQELEELVAQQ